MVAATLTKPIRMAAGRTTRREGARLERRSGWFFSIRAISVFVALHRDHLHAASVLAFFISDRCDSGVVVCSRGELVFCARTTERRARVADDDAGRCDNDPFRPMESFEAAISMAGGGHGGADSPKLPHIPVWDAGSAR